MTRHRAVCALLLAGLLAVGGLATGASAQGKGKGDREKCKRVPMNVLVTHLSNHGKGVDEDARKLDGKLRSQFKYDSLQVLEKRRIDLEIDQVGEIDLPNGRSARVQPIHRGDEGVLMAVDVEDAAKIDARVKDRNMLVIRAGEYDDGDLVLSLEPDCE